MDRALDFLAGLPAGETAVLHAEIATLRAAVDEAVAAEQAERMIRAAKMQLDRVERELDSGYDADYVPTSTLAKADEYVRDVPDRFKTEIVTRIEQWRVRLSGNAPAPVEEIAPGLETPPVQDDHVTLSQARNKINAARNHVAPGRRDRPADHRPARWPGRRRPGTRLAALTHKPSSPRARHRLRGVLRVDGRLTHAGEWK